MLVVADQRAVGVGRQRRLAGAAEGRRRSPCRRSGPILAEQCIGMMPLRRQEEVEEAEDRLLHLAGIGRAADQDQLLREVDRDHRLAAAAVALGIGAEARQVDDREFGLEARQLARFGPHQQGADEEIVPGELVDHADPDAVLGLRAAVEVGDVELVLVGERQQEIVVQAVERVRVHRLVAVVPPDHVLGQRVLDGELVLGAAAGVLAGADDQRPVLGEQALAAADRMLDQRRRRADSRRFRRRWRCPGHQARDAERGRSLKRFPFQHVKSGGGRCLACRRMRYATSAYSRETVARSKRLAAVQPCATVTPTFAGGIGAACATCGRV